MKARTALFAASFLALSLSVAAQERLRVPVAAVVELSELGEEGAWVDCILGDSVAVSFDTPNPFIQGVEFELRIPPPAMAASSTILWSVWRSLDPRPATDRYDYRGIHVATQPLPARVSLVVQVPAIARHTLRSGPYALVIPELVAAERYPLLFHLEAAGKGVSAELGKAAFRLRVRPLFTDEGGIALTLRDPDGAVPSAPPELWADGKKVELRDGILVLKKGVRSIQVSVPGYRDEHRTVTVEPGRVIALSLELVGTAPVLNAQAPDLARIELDGLPWDHVATPRLEIEAGEHTLVCRLGDYTVTRRFTAVKGRTYDIVLSVQLEVTEGP
ncbi:MAG: hypothetical protein JXA15_14445 [Spirochaetales bacterium]|nr:hypothetical protein [Spirochaetales bacterium]